MLGHRTLEVSVGYRKNVYFPMHTWHVIIRTAFCFDLREGWFINQNNKLS